MPSGLFSLRLMFQRSKSESLRDVSVTRIGALFPVLLRRLISNCCIWYGNPRQNEEALLDKHFEFACYTCFYFWPSRQTVLDKHILLVNVFTSKKGLSSTSLRGGQTDKHLCSTRTISNVCQTMLVRLAWALCNYSS